MTTGEIPGLVLLLLRIAAAVILYIFLAWAFTTLWRDLRRQGVQLASRQIPTLTLHPDQLHLETPYHFTRPQLTLGRNPACECLIDDETVSSQHARLIYRHNQWWIDDLNSTNGTYLNGQRITTLTVLTSGDQIRVGKVNISVAIGERPSRPLNSPAKSSTTYKNE